MYWTADLDVDCDGKSSTKCNKKTDAAYQPETAATDSKGKPLDAASLPFVVVPLPSSRFDYKKNGLKLGSVVAVVYKDRLEYGIIGDSVPPRSSARRPTRWRRAWGSIPILPRAGSARA